MDDCKRCARCKTDKPLADFGRRSAATDGLHPWCKGCESETRRANYALHSEEIKAAVQRYRDQNREAVRARDRQRAQRESAKRSAQRRAYYASRRTELLANSAVWHRDNRDKCREAEARYRDANREKRRESNKRLREKTPLDILRAKAVRSAHRRRARMHGTSIGPITAGQIKAKVAYWGNRCWICRGPFQALDHYKPLAKGGPHIVANLRPICTNCNTRKRDRWPISREDLA